MANYGGSHENEVKGRVLWELVMTASFANTLRDMLKTFPEEMRVMLPQLVATAAVPGPAQENAQRAVDLLSTAAQLEQFVF